MMNESRLIKIILVAHGRPASYIYIVCFFPICHLSVINECNLGGDLNFLTFIQWVPTAAFVFSHLPAIAKLLQFFL